MKGWLEELGKVTSTQSASGMSHLLHQELFYLQLRKISPGVVLPRQMLNFYRPVQCAVASSPVGKLIFAVARREKV